MIDGVAQKARKQLAVVKLIPVVVVKQHISMLTGAGTIPQGLNHATPILSLTTTTTALSLHVYSKPSIMLVPPSFRPVLDPFSPRQHPIAAAPSAVPTTLR